MYYSINPAMFSKILVKLIDQAIVPAVTLLATRIVSVVIIAKYFGLNVNIGPSGLTVSDYLTGSNAQSGFIKVNSYSILAMVVVLTVGLLYLLFKSFIFHDSHITPELTAKVFSLRLSSFIQNSFDLYSQGAVWLSYSYLMLFLCGVMILFNALYTWVFLTSVVLTAITTSLFVLDIENEMEIKREGVKEDDSEFILDVEGINA